MTNILKFKSVYKSINSLPEAELPDLVVLTGRNGSGKTHLLEAIQNGAISSSLVAVTNKDVALFNWNNIVPKDTGVFHPSQYQQKRSNWFTQIRQAQEKTLPELRQLVVEAGLPADRFSSIKRITQIDETTVKRYIDDPQARAIVLQRIQEKLQQCGKKVFTETQRHIGDDDWKKVAAAIASERPSLFLETSESNFFAEDRLLWGQVDVFQQAFGRLFSTYRELIHQNDRLEKYPPKDDEGLSHLNDEEFVGRFGEPPWNFVNTILDVCKLDFRVEPPPLHEVGSYEPKLVKCSSDVEMRFQDLSSGEKVLMSFALCLYNAQDARQEKPFPKLLLLDEIDAPLHPSMVASLLETIKSVLVDTKGVSVILTTHSPSTVALAPEDSLYEMNPTGPAVQKISKSRAVAILTYGVPTLSVSLEGRRQVFVESRTDAVVYERLYQLFKADLGSERSLVFVEVGRTNESGGESNAGCEQVERLVSALACGGNASVFGLVDWDGRRFPTDRIHVLSPGLRDGIESLLLDPVLVAAAAIKENIAFCREKGLILGEDTYTSIPTWRQDKWQEVVYRLQNFVLQTDCTQCDSLAVRYGTGMALKVSTGYLHLDDHRLESAVTERFGFFKPKNNRAGGLINHIVSSILEDYPELVPVDLLDTFRGILGEAQGNTAPVEYTNNELELFGIKGVGDK